MERGLLWLPLLALFIGLAWAGGREYQKVEAYRLWAEGFDQAKYDIYAVLGQKGMTLTWGKPTPKGPISLSSFSLGEVASIQLHIDGQVGVEPFPERGRAIALEFVFANPATPPVQIPFTEVGLAHRWLQYLQKLIQPIQAD